MPPPPEINLLTRAERGLIRAGEAAARSLPGRLGETLNSIVVRYVVWRGYRLVPEAALEDKLGEILDTVGEPLGDYLEFGVFTGSSLACMARTAERAGADMRLIGFDSFAGLPAEARQELEDAGVEGIRPWQEGQFRSSRAVTEWYLERAAVDMERVELVEGWFEDTLTVATAKALRLERVSVVMVDCDLYSAARLALDFCAPFLTDVSAVLFDDWHAYDLATRGEGEKRAFEEFLAENSQFSAEPIGGYSDLTEVFVLRRRPVD